MRARPIGMICGALCFGLIAFGAVQAQQRVASPGRSKQPAYAPKNGGADCASATEIGTSLPYTDTGNTCGAPSVVSDYDSFTASGGPCSTYLYPGPEVIYKMDLGDNNDVTVTLTPTDPADLGVFVVSDCADTTSCVGFADFAGGGELAAVTFSAAQTGLCTDTGTILCPAIPAASYYIYIDSFYAGGAPSCGEYQLDVAGTLPVQLMEFSVE